MSIVCRILFLLSFCLISTWAMAQAPAGAPAPVYTVTYVEAGPEVADAVAAKLKELAEATRKLPGNTGFIAGREAGRAARFALVEGWSDKDAAERQAAAAKAVQEQLQANLAAPFDIRPSSGLAVGAPTGPAPSPAVYVVTHVDVPPPAKDQCIALLKQMIEDSRKDAGVLRFDVLQQDSRPNHFTVVEAWRDAKSHDAHIMADHTREYRRKLTPMTGALFDERVYQLIR